MSEVLCAVEDTPSVKREYRIRYERTFGIEQRISKTKGQYPQKMGVIMGREKILENSLKKMSGWSVYYCGNKVNNPGSN